MAINSNSPRTAKTAQLAQQWPDVPDWVFQKLGVSRKELTTFAGKLHTNATVVLPGMPAYPADSASAGDNKPLIIVYCTTFADVRLCLEWARRHSWWVACRAGGHSSAGYSVSSGIVIDVSGINYVAIDPAQKLARIGGGAQFGHINAQLNTYKLHIPGGTCDTVSIGGHMQGGGYGFTSREFGLNCDCVVGVTVMLASGKIVEADSMVNPDLYWAVRGGTGGNFGILLEARYKLWDVQRLWGYCLSWPLEQAPEALDVLQKEYMGIGKDQVGYLVVLSNLGKGPVLLVMGTYHGTEKAGREALAPLVAVGTPTFLFDKTDTYNVLNEALLGVLPGVPDGSGELKDCGYLGTELGVTGWKTFCDYFATSPNTFNIAVIEPYGGKLNSIPVTECAFIHRKTYGDFFIDSFFAASAESKLNDKDSARKWMEGGMQVMAPYFNGFRYQNYPQPFYTDYRWQYWGDSFNSLLFIKQKYDPENFFHFPQSISPYPDTQGITRSQVPSMFTDKNISYPSWDS